MKTLSTVRFIKWTRENPEPKQTLSLRDLRGREMARFSDYRVEVADWTAAPRRSGKVVMIKTWSGGAHGSCCYYLYALGKEDRCLLAYRKGNLIDEDDFDDQDLDQDGVPEIVSWYDGFAYGASVPGLEFSYAGSARIPVVFRFERGRYVEATGHYRAWLRNKLATARREYREDKTRPEYPNVPDYFHRLVECYAIERQLYSTAAARRHIARLAGKRDWTVFRQKINRVDAVLADLRARIAYPEPYRHMPNWRF